MKLEMTSLKKTPLYDRHVSLGAKIINFGGWMMPVYYSGIIAEHRWTRQSCGVFDVSHLGEIRVNGPKAFDFLQHRLTNDLNKLSDGRMLYSLLCDTQGFTLDDILIYQNTREDYYLIVNASNIDTDFQALQEYASEGVTLTNASDHMSCIALQGPRSEAIMEKALGLKVKDLAYYSFKEESFAKDRVWVSRSGYTGEDGFEIFSANELAPALWDALMAVGEKGGVLPAGLGARNTLRLEAGNALYGNDVDARTTPLEARLGWAVAFNKTDFVGRAPLLAQKEKGIQKKLVGFKVLDKAVAREHYPIAHEGRSIGMVTSGSYGPTVDANIGLGYVEKGLDAPGTQIEIQIHGRFVKAEVVKTPFVPLKHKK